MALDAYHRELAKLNSVSSCPTIGSAGGLPGKPVRLHDLKVLNYRHQTSLLKNIKENGVIVLAAPRFWIVLFLCSESSVSQVSKVSCYVPEDWDSFPGRGWNLSNHHA
jgi:hypothetical protein